MTREVAIKELQESVDTLREYDIAHSSRLKQALEMAIQALSQEPCDDTVSIRNDVLKCRVGKIVAYNVEWLKKHWQMEMDIVCGVKPCDDAISRILTRMWNCRGKHTTNIDKVAMEQIIRDELPSVTQKSGNWIEDAKTYYEELNKRGLGVDEYTPYFTDDIACSECLAKYSMLDNETQFFKYCPNCGEKME